MSDNAPYALQAGEELVGKSDLIIYRQITEHLWNEKDRKPSSSAFGPATADKLMPSFVRSDKVSAQASRDWHNENARSPSLSVWAVSVAEVDEAATAVVDDSAVDLGEGEIRAPGHCFVEYRHLESKKSEVRQVRLRLLVSAIKRGEQTTKKSRKPKTT